MITSVSRPTENVKYLQDALFEWCLVVVGDAKSPASWAYKDATFLSLQDQLDRLAKRYSIIDHLPSGSYLRKLVGYLYAIEHGARYIYETDDDNAAVDGLLGFRYENNFNGLVAKKCTNDFNKLSKMSFVNPYAYFGQTSMWPRGYPLEMIGSQEFNCSSYELSHRMPLIQQGLVNGDPDVDAIYRYLSKTF